MLFRLAFLLLTNHLQGCGGARIIESGQIGLASSFVQVQLRSFFDQTLDGDGHVHDVGMFLQVEIREFRQETIIVREFETLVI